MTSGSGVREKVSSQMQETWQWDSSGRAGSNCTCCVSSIVVSEGGIGGVVCLFCCLASFVSFVSSTEFASFPDSGLMEELYGFFLKRQD